MFCYLAKNPVKHSDKDLTYDFFVKCKLLYLYFENIILFLYLDIIR